MTAEKVRPEWIDIVKQYQRSNHWRSTWQMVNTLIPFFAIWTLMYNLLDISYWLVLALAVVNAGFAARIFIFLHDCGHNSFFNSTKLNNFIGSILGVLTLTPYYHWRKQHAKHHATSGDLEFRGFGDVDTLTVNEYKELDAWDKLKYRFYRSPMVMFTITPFLVFFIMHRYPYNATKNERKEIASVWWTNAAILAVVLGMGFWLGFWKFFLVQFPISMISSIWGVYLFYVQHQFEDTYWRWHKDWDYTKAALEGSTFFRLPKILQWFSGNIGFHHVHHLAPKIPNYLLEEVHYKYDIFQKVETLTIKTSIRTIFLHLWDEELDRLISFREFRRRYAMGTA